MNDAAQLDLCLQAIRHTLVQVKTRPEVRYVLGAGTESFDRLTTAYAALTNHPGGAKDVARRLYQEAREPDVCVRVVRLHDFAHRLERLGLAAGVRRDVLRECGFDGDEIDAAIGGAK